MGPPAPKAPFGIWLEPLSVGVEQDVDFSLSGQKPVVRVRERETAEAFWHKAWQRAELSA